MNYKGQGAIEYLLLLAAAVVVVAVVISFMISTAGPVMDSGDRTTYDFICKTNDTNNLVCGCYMKDGLRGEKGPAGTWIAASTSTCPESLPGDIKGNPIFNWQ